MKRVSVLAVILTIASCGGSGDAGTDAAVLVAGDLLSHAPSGLEPYLGGEWETGRRSQDSIRADVLGLLATRTGLPVASPGMVSQSSEPMAVLFLFRPELLGEDSVRVRAGWLSFSNGETSGEEYSYLLRCARSCELVERAGPEPLG